MTEHFNPDAPSFPEFMDKIPVMRAQLYPTEAGLGIQLWFRSGAKMHEATNALIPWHERTHRDEKRFWRQTLDIQATRGIEEEKRRGETEYPGPAGRDVPAWNRFGVVSGGELVDWLVQPQVEGERYGVVAKEGVISFHDASGAPYPVARVVAQGFARLHARVPEGFTLEAVNQGSRATVTDLLRAPTTGTWRDLPLMRRASALHAFEMRMRGDEEFARAIDIVPAMTAEMFLGDGHAERLGMEGHVRRAARAAWRPGSTAEGDGPADELLALAARPAVEDGLTP